MPDDTRFIVDKIFSARDLHIIYGPSGAGRTRLLLQTMNSWRLGQPVFEQPSHPAAFLMMSTVETPASLDLTFAQYGLSAIPHHSLINDLRREEFTIEGVVRRARELNSSVRVLWIDGLTGLCPGNIAIYREAALFIRSIKELCLIHNLTIIGTASCGKSDAGDATDNARHRLLGSVAWNDHAGTRILIDYTKPGKRLDLDRTIHVLPPNQAELVGRYTIDPVSNWLVKLEGADDGLQKELDEWLATQQPGAELSSQDIQVAGLQMGLSRSTVFNWIRDAVELGMLLKVRYGVYTRAPIPGPTDIQ